MRDLKSLTKGVYTGEYRRWDSVKKIAGIIWLFLQLEPKDACKGWSYVWPFIKNEIEIMSLRTQLRRMDKALKETLAELNQLRYEAYVAETGDDWQKED